MTAQQQLNQLPDSSRAILEAAALLDQPFAVSLLIDLGFSVEALDPLFDNGIFGEPFPTRAEFTDSELRNQRMYVFREKRRQPITMHNRPRANCKWFLSPWPVSGL